MPIYRKGDLVYIKSASFSCGEAMNKFIGTVQTIKEIRDAGKALLIKGFYWGPYDVEHANIKDQESEIFHFDERHLEI